MLNQSPMEIRLTRVLLISPLLSFLVAVNPSLAAPRHLRSSYSDGEKVPVVLYYETLCPYCANFIVNGLSKVFDEGLTSIIDLKLVPYGNAKIGANNTISCQVSSIYLSPSLPLDALFKELFHGKRTVFEELRASPLHSRTSQ